MNRNGLTDGHTPTLPELQLIPDTRNPKTIENTWITFRQSTVYPFIIAPQGSHTTNHYNWRGPAQMVRSQYLICQFRSVRENDSREFGWSTARPYNLWYGLSRKG